VTVTVTDAAGNPATCPTTVTVVDQTAPVITLCPPAQELPAGPTCTALVPDLTGALLATDCDPNLTRTQTPPAGTVIGLGDTTVTLTVRDGAANATPCEVTLTVRDATPPAITAGAPPQTLVADAQCQAGVPDFTGALTATDCHGPLTVTQSPPAGAPAGLGQTLVTLTVTDAAGNPATSETTLTVRDETAPAIASCAPAPTLAADATGQATLPDLTGLVQAADCGGPLTVSQAPPAGTRLELGETPVTFTVTDAAGNAAHCAVPVTVVQAPRITQQPASTTNELGSALELPATAGGSAPLAWQWHHGTNALADATNATLTLAPLAFADAGEYWARVRNAAGSTDTQPATVTVVDTTAPLITACAPAPTLAAGPGCQAPLPELTGLVGATDLNLPLTVTQTPPAGTLLDLGETTVTVTVTDAAGNPATCPTTVTVVDQTAPVITLCPPAQELPAGPTCTALVPDLTGALLATDCDPNLTRTQTPPAGTVIGLGDTTVTLTVRDGAANATPCEVTLTVRDATPPAITAGAPPQTLVADAQCQAGVPDFTGALTATDCHGPLTVTQSPPAGAPAGLGQTLVTLTVTDAAGNPATSETTLTVRDETAPAIASCAPAPTLAADATGQATLPDLTGLVQAADCGGPLTVSQAPPAGTRLELGETPVTFTVTDAAGNAAHCAVPVTVVQAPRITQQPASTTNELGSALTLTAAATGGAPLTWQWFQGTNALAGQTNTTLVIASLTAEDAGEYWARVSNAVGEALTMIAVVVVIPPERQPPAELRIVEFSMQGIPTLEFKGSPGAMYVLEACAAVGGHWTELRGVTELVNEPGTYRLMDTSATSCPIRFYRAR
jgi:hypothetical protein